MILMRSDAVLVWMPLLDLAGDVALVLVPVFAAVFVFVFAVAVVVVVFPVAWLGIFTELLLPEDFPDPLPVRLAEDPLPDFPVDRPPPVA